MLSWIILSIALQTAALAYINYIYIPSRGFASVFKEDSPEVKNRSITLPKGARDITVSHDGVYAAYRVENDLFVLKTDSNKAVKVPIPHGSETTFIRWLPDRDMLVFAEKEPGGGKGHVCISTYDINSELVRSYPVITGLPEGSEITGIELSPLTNVVYAIIRVNDDTVKVYKFDIMDNLHYVMTTDPGTILKANMYADNLIYQEEVGKIKIRNGGTGNTAEIPVKEANQLLGVDDMDFIYAAACGDDGSISRIYRGKAGQTQEEWVAINLEKPYAKSDILISPDGLIYNFNVEENYIRNIESGAVTGFDGELLAVTPDYAVSLKNRKLYLTVLIK